MVDYKTKEDWCESFLTCFHSSVLQRRCLEDFYFYKHFFLQSPTQQAFTFEISTYLPATRIQVNYCPYPYLFSVNIIHCDSGGRYNESGTYLILVMIFLNKKLMLLRVVGSVGQSLKPLSNVWANNSQHFVPKRGATMLDPFLKLFRHCWGHSLALNIFYKVFWVVFCPGCTAGPNIVCQHGSNNC